MEEWAKHLKAAGLVLGGALLGYLAATLTWLFAIGAVLCFIAAFAVERVTSMPTASGIQINVRLPTIRRRRRLRDETLTLVRDIREYLKAQPSPMMESLREHRERVAAMNKAPDEASKNEIWQRLTDRDMQRSESQRQELERRFGGRARYVFGEYVRLEMLEQKDLSLLLWKCNSNHWIAEAASEMEALAMRLR